MNCEYCNCKLRKCKYELIENRTFHYKCYEFDCKRKRQEELENFLLFFAEKGIIVKI
jgi:ribosomal protein S6